MHVFLDASQTSFQTGKSHSPIITGKEEPPTLLLIASSISLMTQLIDPDFLPESLSLQLKIFYPVPLERTPHLSLELMLVQGVTRGFNPALPKYG